MADAKDFILNVRNPVDRVLEGFQAGNAARRQPVLEQREQANFERQQAVQGQQDILFEQGQVDRGNAQQEVQRQRQLAEEFQKDLEYLSQNPNAENYTSMVAKHPKYLSEIKSAFEMLDSANRQTRLLDEARVYSAIQSGNVDAADAMMSEKIDALRNSNRESEVAPIQAMRDLLAINPDAVKTAIGIDLAVLGDGVFNTLLGAGKVARSTDFKDGTILRVMTDGTRVVTDPAGRTVTGDEAAQVLTAANDFETQITIDRAGGRREATLEADIGLGGEAAAAEIVGKRGAEIGFEALEDATQARVNVRNVDAAINALRNGAKTGFIQANFPNINAATTELDNIRSRLGLDIIGSATFGALSKGELDLALNTALPTRMDEPELIDWLERRKEAQLKLLNEYEEAARYLTNPGNNIQGWLELKGIGTPQTSPDGSTTDQISNDMQSLLNAFGGQ